MSTKAKILYVDDEPLNLHLFKINFSKKYEVYTAPDGFDGLNILEKQPDIWVIISDLKMPEMNGLEFVSKARVNHPSKMYYILTGFDITPELQTSLENGVILKYFKKPFNLKEIESAIESAF